MTTLTLADSRDKDWMYSVQMNRWILKPIGIWPRSLCVSTAEKINSVILALISCFLIGFLLIPCTLCTVLDKTGDLDAKIKMIGPLSFCVMAMTKYYILASRGNKITECVENIQIDWARTRADQCEEDREIMMGSAKIGRSLAIFCAGIMYSGGFFYTTVMPLSTKRTELVGNETVRSQAFPIYRGLLDPRTSPSFEIVQLMQCLASYVMYSVTVGACGLAAVFVMHACGQFRILVAKLNRLVDDVQGDKNLLTHEQKMGDIVEHHLKILSFVSKIEGLLNEICFVELIGCTMNICFLGYYMLTEWEQSETIGIVTYFILLISFTFNIFILCYIGEILSEQCTEIGSSAYMIDWYRLSEKKALGLILILAVSNSSIKLTAGKLVELSLNSFCGVVKSSLAYLSLLRTLTTETLLSITKQSFVPLFLRLRPSILPFNLLLNVVPWIQSVARTCAVNMLSSNKLADSPGNFHYENDIHYTLQFCHWTLKLLGIYSFIYNRPSKLERATSIVLILLCCSILQFVVVPFSYYVIFYEKDMNTKIKFIAPLTFAITSFLKYAYLGARCSTFGRCIEHVRRDWKIIEDEEHRDIMIQHVTMSRKLIKICAAFLYTGGMSYHTIMPLLSKKNENNTDRPLTYPGYEAFFDVQQSPTYEFVYCMHCFYVLVTGNIAMTAYSFTAIFTIHACGQIKIQTVLLESLKKEKIGSKKGNLEERLAIVVRNHTEILRFMKNVENALREFFLAEVTVSTLLICLLLYHCLMEWESSDSVAILTYVALLISFVFHIMIFCYVGELLLEQGSKIATASYDTEWYNLPGRRARGIVLLLAVSKYPLQLTAGKVIVLSLNTFGTVLKTAVVYLNMLRTVTEY